MAAIDGIQNKIDPGEPLENNIYDLPAEELAAIPKTPGSLNQALFALENDYQFLLRGDVFTEELISTWIAVKKENEADEIRGRPHPYEFCMYYDV